MAFSLSYILFNKPFIITYLLIIQKKNDNNADKSRLK